VFRLIDLTQTLTAESTSYPGDVLAFTAERDEIGSPLATVSRFTSLEAHAGTHLDAPLHFAPGGADVTALPLRFYPAIVIRINGAWIEAASVPEMCEGHAVLFATGWEDHAGTPAYYEGYPTITRAAAQLLVDRGVGLVGLDTPGVDSGAEHPSYPAHEILCAAAVPIVEGLVNLETLETIEGDVLFGAFPLKLAGLEGSPVRAVALVRWSEGEQG